MTKLRERANEIIGLKSKQNNAEKQQVDEAVQLKKKMEMEMFEKLFGPVLEMLQEEGITYEYHLNDDRYFHLGGFIQFQHNGHILRMDFDGGAYRYEYTPRTNGVHSWGMMVYDRWPLDRFIVWIAKELLNYPA